MEEVHPSIIEEYLSKIVRDYLGEPTWVIVEKFCLGLSTGWKVINPPNRKRTYDLVVYLKIKYDLSRQAYINGVCNRDPI